MNVSGSLSYCYVRSLPQTDFEDTEIVLSNITSTSDILDYMLDVELNSNHHAKMANQDGWNALCKASYLGNLPLVRHITDTNKNTTLVNLGTFFGWAPIVCASLCKQAESAVEIARLLINLGAEVNASTASERTIEGCRVTTETLIAPRVPQQATALWCSINITHNVVLSQLLKDNCGVYHPVPAQNDKGTQLA